ncbi:MAG TPA: hypothetical protein VH853_03160 [Polyangia bacterium]|jgi:hypothetical protein|nr:hypothetical protein [Polyangia bacterium]
MIDSSPDPSPVRPFWCIAAVACGLGLASAVGCRTAGPLAPAGPSAALAPAPPRAPLPLIALAPADAVRARLALTAVVAPAVEIERQFAQLVRRLGVPFNPSESLLDLLTRPIGGVRLGHLATAELDPARAVALVGIAEPIGLRVSLCLAIPFRDAGSARRALEATGVEEQRADGASARRLPGGRIVWAALGERTLFLSKAPAAIRAGGALALEIAAAASVGPAPGAATLEVHPQAFGPGLPLLARVAGLGAARNVATAKRPGRQKITPAMSAMLQGFGGLLAESVAETRLVRIVLGANEDTGLAFRLELVPLAGTAFAQDIATAAPYSVDARLPIGDDRTALTAWGTRGPAAALLVALIKGSGLPAQPLALAFDRMGEEIDGAASCAMRFGKPIETYCSWPLKPGARPREAVERYLRLAEETSASSGALTGHFQEPAKIERHGDVVEIDEPSAFDDRPSAKAARQIALGGEIRRVAVTVKDGRLLTAQGAKPRELLATLTRATPNVPGALLGPALARTGDANTFLYFDLPSMLVELSAGSEDPGLRQLHLMLAAIPGMAELRAPLVMTIRGHDQVDVELVASTATLENVARVVRPFMGVMGTSQSVR